MLLREAEAKEERSAERVLCLPHWPPRLPYHHTNPATMPALQSYQPPPLAHQLHLTPTSPHAPPTARQLPSSSASLAAAAPGRRCVRLPCPPVRTVMLHRPTPASRALCLVCRHARVALEWAPRVVLARLPRIVGQQDIRSDASWRRCATQFSWCDSRNRRATLVRSPSPYAYPASRPAHYRTCDPCTCRASPSWAPFVQAERSTTVPRTPNAIPSRPRPTPHRTLQYCMSITFIGLLVYAVHGMCDVSRVSVDPGRASTQQQHHSSAWPCGLRCDMSRRRVRVLELLCQLGISPNYSELVLNHILNPFPAVLVYTLVGGVPRVAGRPESRRPL